MQHSSRLEQGCVSYEGFGNGAVASSPREHRLENLRRRARAWLEREERAVRYWLVTIASVGAAFFAIRFFDGIRPTQTWLFADLCRIWGYQVLLTAACASSGHAVLSGVLGLKSLPNLERIALSLTLGLICFGVGMYVGGYLSLYGPAFAIVLPVMLLLAGAPQGIWALLRARPRRTAPKTFSAAGLLASAFGLLGLAALYLETVAPDAVNYDASWNHLVIAQDYAREGRIVPFIGDWVKNVPHLGSIVNTWAFLVPGFDQPAQRWMLALHNEFTVLLWTLVGVAAGVRYLAERAELRGGWAAMFLFPGLFVYDGNLGGSADHFLALFAVPAFLATARSLKRFAWQETTLVGLFAGGALLTKLHAVYLLVPLALVLAGRAAYLLTQKPPGRTRKAILAALGAGALSFTLLSLLHFGKNAVYYGNPVYPLAQGLIASTPTLPDAATQLDYLFIDWRYHPPTEWGERLKKALEVAVTFSFEPHYSFVNNVPVFGSLYTLTLPLILLLRRARRLQLAAAVSFAAVALWAATFQVDRNLQTLLPLLACVTGAVLVRAWEMGWVPRVALAVLVSVQVVWGADYWFSGTARIDGALSLIRSGIEGRARQRYSGYRRNYIALGASLPKNALVMLHQQHVMLGIDRPVLLDAIGFQGIIDYSTFGTARDLYQRLKQLGVTHVVWTSQRRAPSKQVAVIFEQFAAYHESTTRSFGALLVSPLAPTPPKQSPPLRALTVGIPGYRDGLYDVRQLSVCEDMPAKMLHFPEPGEVMSQPADAARLLAKAQALLVRPDLRLSPQVKPLLIAFALRHRYPGFDVYTRRVTAAGF